MLAKAMAKGKITPASAETLKSQNRKWLRAHLAALPEGVHGNKKTLVGRSLAGTHSAEAPAKDTAKMVLRAQDLDHDQLKAIKGYASDAGKSVDDFLADMNKAAQATIGDGGGHVQPWDSKKA